MSLTTTNEFQGGMPGYGGFGGFGGGLGGFGLVGLVGLNNLLGRDGYGYGGFPGAGGAGTVVTEQNISDIRQEIGALGNEFQMALQASDNASQANFRDLDNRLCNSEKETMQMGFALSTQGFQNTQAIKDQLTVMGSKIDSQFCAVNGAIMQSTQTILNQLCADKLDEKNDLIDTLRAEKNHLTQIGAFNSAISGVYTAIGNLAQKQDLTNQTIQFGTGNLATPVATNNQVG